MIPFQDPKVENKFLNYPEHVRPKLLNLRQLIFDTAEETEGINQPEESLKWNEPSYKTKRGSAVRMDWKSSQPEHYALYFTCSTNLVETFRKLYGNTLQFDGNRAIVFNLSDELPVLEVKHCLTLALTYHKIKHLPMLGV